MTKRHKAFRGGKSISEYEPIDFDLNDQNFVCKPALQGAVLLEFVAAADGNSGGAAAGALYGFFEDAMAPEEYTRFRDYLKGDVIIDMELIGEIAAWLVEEYTARPTLQSEPSGSGPSSPGTESTESASSAA